MIYINEKINRDEWETFSVGKTTFNDEALRQAGPFPSSLPRHPPQLTQTGEMVIFKMRKTQPAYNLISNNCQNFASNMVDAIHRGSHKKFATSFAVYQAATGPGTVLELFPEEEEGVGEEAAGESVRLAERVMDENTGKLNKHDKLVG